MAATRAHDPRWALLVAILGSSMAFLDGTVVNVALPVCSASLGATVDELQWIVEAYALLLASLVLVGGALGDRLGRRRGVLRGGRAVRARLGRLRRRAGRRACSSPRAPFRASAPRCSSPEASRSSAPAYRPKTRGAAIGTWSALSAITAGGRAGRGRLGRHARLVALAVLLQRPGRGGGRRAGDAPGRRDARSRGAPAHLDLAGAALATLGLGLVVYALIDAGRAAALGSPRARRAAAPRRADAGGLRRRRGAAWRADGPARAVPLAHLRRRQPAHAAPLRGARRRAVLRAVQSDPGAGLLAGRRGRRAAPVRAAHLDDEPLGRRAGGQHRPARVPLSAGRCSRPSRFALLARPGDRRQLLDARSSPASLVLGLGMGVHRRAAHRRGHGRGRSRGTPASPRGSTTRSPGPPGCWRSPRSACCWSPASTGARRRARRGSCRRRRRRAVDAQRTGCGGADFSALPAALRAPLRAAFEAAYVAAFRHAHVRQRRPRRAGRGGRAAWSSRKPVLFPRGNERRRGCWQTRK